MAARKDPRGRPKKEEGYRQIAIRLSHKKFAEYEKAFNKTDYPCKTDFFRAAIEEFINNNIK